MTHSSNNFALRMLGLCTLCLFLACQQQSERSFAKQSPAPPPQDIEEHAKLDRAPAASAAASEQFQDAAANGDIFSSAAAAPNAIDSIKKFVRTAQMRFRVKNTTEATLHIEDIAIRNGGFVVSSNLNSQLELQQTTPLNRDSAMETTRYTMLTQLVIRVPYRMLDTTLRSIGRLSDFLDLRHVSAEDVGLQLLEQELSKLREGIYRSDLNQSEENKISPKADRNRASRAATDQARIESLKLEDAIRYSTVRVDIYQLPQIRQTIVANTNVPIPQQALATRLGDALSAGADILILLLLGIVHLWSVILLAVTGFFIWKKYQKRNRAVVTDADKS
ncbi:MAG: DUF4349 domain-containing protein [Saprospiraceae bacterium]